MLYMVSFHFNGEFLSDELYSSTKCIKAFKNCYLVDTTYTAEGLKTIFQPQMKPRDTLIISKLFRNYCAGKLDRNPKEFIANYINRDPFPEYLRRSKHPHPKLYCIVYQLADKNGNIDEVFDNTEIFRSNIMIFNNCYLINSVYSAVEIQKHMLGHLCDEDRFCISKIYKHHYADVLSEYKHEFLLNSLNSMYDEPDY